MLDKARIKNAISGTLQRIFGTSSAKVEHHHITQKSISPANDMIRLGSVQLNTLSPYLSVLPDEAKADILVAPQDLMKIDGRGLDALDKTLERIRNITDYFGLKGMRLFDRSKGMESISYEHGLYRQLARDFADAWISGRSVTTNLFLPTEQILEHLYADREQIRTAGGEALIARHGDMNGAWYRSCTEDPGDQNKNISVRVTHGIKKACEKEKYALPVRLVALELHPPG